MYGLLATDGVRFAVPLDVLREVVPWPAQIVPLPVAVPGLLGAADVRGEIVPLLDLTVATGRTRDGATRDADRVMAVLLHEGGLLGLAVDSVHGVAEVPDDVLQPVTPSGLVLTAGFEHPEDGTVTSVLDVAALVATVGVPTLRERPVPSSVVGPVGSAGPTAPAAPTAPADVTDDAGPAAEGDAPTTDVRPVVRLRCAGHQLCVPAVDVHAVLPALRPSPSPMDGPLCRGTTQYREVEIPVVDLAALLGLGRQDDVASTPGVLLRLERGLVALAVTEVIDIEPLDVATVLPPPSGTVRQPHRYAGLLPHAEHGQLLLLDTAELLADPDLEALSGLNQAVGAADGAAGPSSGRASGSGGAAGPGRGDDEPVRGDVRPDERPYLTYAVGGATEVATLLEQVGEILAFPVDRAVTGTGDGHFTGVFVHRDRAVSLVCLASLLALPGVPEPSAATVLLVTADGRDFGFVVSALRAIERASWSETPGPDDGTLPDLRRAPAVKVGSDRTTQRLLPAVDLVAVARGLAGDAPSPGVPSPRSAADEVRPEPSATPTP